MTRHKKCATDAKAMAIEGGMKEREYAAVKRNGEDEESARAWSACKIDATMTDADCEAAAKSTYEKVSGTTDQASWDSRKGKIQELGEAKRRGDGLQMSRKKAIQVDGTTSATACSDALQTSFRSKLMSLIDASPTINKTGSVSGKG